MSGIHYVLIGLIGLLAIVYSLLKYEMFKRRESELQRVADNHLREINQITQNLESKAIDIEEARREYQKRREAFCKFTAKQRATNPPPSDGNN